MTAAGCPASSGQEVDPVYAASAASGVSSSDLDRWNAAAGFGDHAEAGYLTAESDPVFAASAAAGIDDDDISRWDDHTHDDLYPGRAEVYTRGDADAVFVARGRPAIFNVPAPAFIPRFATADIDYLGGQGLLLTGATSAVTLYAPVPLPDGATVTGLRCFVRDRDTTEDFVETSRVQLLAMAVPDFDVSFDVVVEADVVTTGAAGSQTFFRATGSFPGNPRINNASFQYVLTASLQVAGASADFFDPMFRGCQVDYTTP